MSACDIFIFSRICFVYYRKSGCACDLEPKTGELRRVIPIDNLTRYVITPCTRVVRTTCQIKSKQTEHASMCYILTKILGIPNMTHVVVPLLFGQLQYFHLVSCIQFAVVIVVSILSLISTILYVVLDTHVLGTRVYKRAVRGRIPSSFRHDYCMLETHSPALCFPSVFEPNSFREYHRLYPLREPTAVSRHSY